MPSRPLTLLFALLSPALLAVEPPDPHRYPESPLMLAGSWVPENPQTIDFQKLPHLPGKLAIVSDVTATNGVNQHSYLAFHDGRYWCMWSDGPAVEDNAGQVVKYSTSLDGEKWEPPQMLTGYPPHSGPETKVYRTRSKEGLRYISRGFWVRDGELLALVSLDEAAGFFGPSLALHAFRWQAASRQWEDLGVILENGINNFPPLRLRTGEWMMSRRPFDYGKKGVEFVAGGVASLHDWKSFPVLGSNSELKAEEPDWWILPDHSLAALFRDNRKSGYLYRSFSTDDGRTWSKPAQTNFPDATSKLSGLRLSDGRYVLVSNANPKRRDPLVLSVSDDGLVFTRMFYLIGDRPKTIDYPHVIEHDGSLLVAFAGEKKQRIEVMKISLADLNVLKMPETPSVKP